MWLTAAGEHPLADPTEVADELLWLHEHETIDRWFTAVSSSEEHGSTSPGQQ
jgi:hypothetical protein